MMETLLFNQSVIIIITYALLFRKTAVNVRNLSFIDYSLIMSLWVKTLLNSPERKFNNRTNVFGVIPR